MREQQGIGYAVPKRRASAAPPPQYTMQRQPMYTDTMDDEELYDYPQTTGRSVVVRKRPLPAAPGQPQRVQRQGRHPLFFIGLLICSGSIMFFLISFIGAQWQGFNNSLKYGYPRSFQTDANVGHGDSHHPISHFVAINNHGLIEVIEIPGDPSRAKPYLYVIAQISSDNADQIPVTLAFTDVNGDGKVDMQVIVNNTIYLLYNTGTSFQDHT